MKHLMFLVTALFLAVFPSLAQTTQVATLSHEGTITTFYSANALKDAYAAAADGDIITLSSGTFLHVDIAKNITIRGAGMDLASNPTIIAGNFSLKNTATETNSVTLEGLYVNGEFSTTGDYVSDVRIIKCYIKEPKTLYMRNFTIANCKFDRTQLASSSNGNIINSYLGRLDPSYASISCTNCIIGFDDAATYKINELSNSSLKNCIIETAGQTYSSTMIPLTTTLINCYHFGTATNPFRDAQTKDCVMLEARPFANDDFELTEEAKAICIGDDGTEAGIHGGLLPFDPTPTNPQITKFNVAKKTTADGKLSVDIEVKANN